MRGKGSICQGYLQSRGFLSKSNLIFDLSRVAILISALVCCNSVWVNGKLQCLAQINEVQVVSQIESLEGYI